MLELDRRRGAESSPRGDPERVGRRERVPEDGLEDDARAREGGPGDRGRDGPREVEREDLSRAQGRGAGDEGRHGHEDDEEEE